MTKFLDGPAAGQTLSLRRAPILLRVVVRRRLKKGMLFPVTYSTWDALDDPSDEPKPDEQIYVYRLASVPSRMFIRACGKGKKALGGAWPMAEYTFLAEQPDERHTREKAAWFAWADWQGPAIQRELLLAMKKAATAAAKDLGHNQP